MDWSRAKNVLILAFLSINLLLGYRLWAGPGGANASLYSVTRQEVLEVTAQLRDRGVVLVGRLPREARPAPLLAVENPPPDPDAVAARFFGAGVKGQREEAGWRYQGPAPTRSAGSTGSTESTGSRGSAGATLLVSPSGALYYHAELPAAAGHIDERTAVSIARDFWQARGGLPSGMQLDYHMPVGPARFLVVFTQQTQGAWFFGATAVALVEAGGVREAHASWPNPVRWSGPQRPVLPATEALLRAIPLLTRQAADGGKAATSGAAQGVVLGVDPGYYSQTYDAREWEAVPVWRLRLGSGEVVYVNAYTGAIEGAGPALVPPAQESPRAVPKSASHER